MPSCRKGFAQSWKPDNAAIARYCPWVHKLCLSAGLAWAQTCANSIIVLAHHSSGGAGNAICTSHCVCVLDALQGGELFCQIPWFDSFQVCYIPFSVIAHHYVDTTFAEFFCGVTYFLAHTIHVNLVLFHKKRESEAYISSLCSQGSWKWAKDFLDF